MESSSTYPTRKLLFSLDTPSAVPVTPGESYVKGWFVPEDGNTYDLYVVADGASIPAFTGLPRPDVARHHRNSPAFKKSGFLARFRRPHSEVSVKLVARAADTELVLAEGIAVPPFTGIGSTPSNAVPTTGGPLISILLPIPDVHPYLLTRCVESIRQQHYTQWQLCIGYESSEESASREYLEKIAHEDPRSKLVKSAASLISELRRQALEVSDGDFVLSMNYRDELDPFALAEFANSLTRDDNVDLLYPDEDGIDFYGHQGRSFSKPDFDPEALLSWNFIGNGALLRRSVLLRAGGYKATASHSGDWDLMLRMLEIAGASRVRHIAKPLYHLRKDDELPGEADPASRNPTSPKPIHDHLARSGISATVEAGLFPGSFRLRRQHGPGPRVAVFVRSEDGAFQQAALAAFVNPRTTRIYELLGSGADLLADSRLPRAEQFASGPARTLNEMPEDVFLFINRPLDTVNQCFVDELAAQAMREDCGLVTGIALDETGRILHGGLSRGPGGEMIDSFAGIHFSQGDLLRNLSVVRSVDEIRDAFFAVKRSGLVALGGFAAVSSTRMPELVQRLVNLAHSAGARVLVTPYAVATFDTAGLCGHLSTEETMSQDGQAGNNSEAAEAERKLAAAQLREIASERNRLRRDLVAAEEALTRLEKSKCEELRRQVQELNTALETERRVIAGIQNSVSWKLTAPLRACMRLVRGN